MTITLYHGTSVKHWEGIQRAGEFRPPDVDAMVARVARWFAVEPYQIERNGWFGFSKGRRGDTGIYFSAQRDIANSYSKTGSEVFFDAVRAAAAVVFGDDLEGGRAEERNEAIGRATILLMGHPMILTLEVPWGMVGKHDPRFATEAQWRKAMGRANTIIIEAPVSASFVTDAEVIR